MKGKYNFSAGPAMLPAEVIKRSQQALNNWKGTGLSILEIGHRTDPVIDMLHDTQQKLIKLLNLPERYKTLFLGQSARTHFGLIPQNYINDPCKGAYVVSGYWSSMAMQEASRLSPVYKYNPFSNSQIFKDSVAGQDSIDTNTAYVYFTPNETIDGIRIDRQWLHVQEPVIADMTSCLLTEPLDMKQYSMIFAGAQKNISIPGLTLLIINENELPENTKTVLPVMSDYKFQIQHNGHFATPPVFACFVANMMFEWIGEQGGLKSLHQKNLIKASTLYDFIDESSFYNCDVPESQRSIVNICFNLNQKNLENKFLFECEKKGLVGLKGHRAKGGIRASLYNAMPQSGVNELLDVMNQFAKEHS